MNNTGINSKAIKVRIQRKFSVKNVLGFSVLYMVAGLVDAHAAVEANLVRTKYIGSSAGQGQITVTPGVAYSEEIGDLKGGGRISETGAYQVLKLETGVGQDSSASIDLRYQNGNQTLRDARGEKDGLADITLNWTSTSKLNADSSLAFGAIAKISTEDKEMTTRFKWIAPGKSGVDIVSSNAQSGGASLNPFVALQRRVGTDIVGARLIQSVYGSRRDVNIEMQNHPLKGTDKFERKEKGGGVTDLAVFYETAYQNFSLGTSLSYRHVSHVDYVSPSTSRYSDGFDLVGLELTPSYEISSDLSIEGQLKYQELLSDEVLYKTQQVTDASLFNSTLGVKMLF